jgi:hypothetical protein
VGRLSTAGWYAPEIPALKRLSQEDYEFEVCLGYILKPCLKTLKIPKSILKIPKKQSNPSKKSNTGGIKISDF